MTGSTWVDVIVVVLMILAAISGYRQGAAASVLAFIGVVLGAAAGVLLAPHVLGSVDDAKGRLLLGVGLLAGLVIIGELSGMVLGRAVRSSIRSTGLRTVDSGVGAVVQVGALLVAAWLVAIPLTSAAAPQVSRSVNGSAVLGAVNEFAKVVGADGLPQKFSAIIDDSGLPQALGPFVNTPVVSVETPDRVDFTDPAVQRVRSSVVRIDGQAPSCSRALEGSGFVATPGRVVTNAHVVAGTRSVQVTVDGTKKYSAQVVYFDAQTDVAVLNVPGLQAKPLRIVFNGAKPGDPGFVLGYPGGGPLTLSSSRVRSQQTLEGRNIYRDAQVRRDVYLLRGQVRPGNSGGPVFDRDGNVVGVIFGVAVDDADTAFALTAKQVEPALQAGTTATAGVSTGACVNR
ncbi:MarP family serine protease [Tsukamurella paurometabola]|uniref:MarP family serine protease n=1 Tax=Tsukamurella paurometabola TaxID=2061 RepID=A0A3P8MDH4_TSUPA|nr:MarP family serine protease [Tsukamurella paurometabola]MBS4103426.1 MarP family serine protease [Tsukamurella paurometabola]UEA81827.1 MarP family serine protease [Tsukamurella paurometabola]VDR38843.1 Serine protease Rv3671c [Tsukamurella paurometabola]